MSIEIEDVVRGAFQAVLGREIDPGNLAQASASLAQGLPVETFLTSMLTCPEYLNRSDRREFTTFTPVAIETDGRRLWIDLSDTFVSRVCMGGNYEPSETAFVRANLKQGDTFLDVGANIGWFATLAAQIVGPKGTVHAFEPRDDIRSLLARSVIDNGIGRTVEVHDAIVTDHSGEARLVWKAGHNNPGGTRVMPEDEAFREGMAIQPARAVAIDDLKIKGHLSLIKMDIEGAEGLALRGAQKTLARHRPLIVTEVCDAAFQRVAGHGAVEFAALVRSLGYDIRELVEGRAGEIIDDDAALVTEHPISVVLTPR